MGKATAKKRRATKSKLLLGKRSEDDSMMVVDTGAAAAPRVLTGREKHAEKVRAKRALRDEKTSIKKARLAMPKASTALRGERKALTAALKGLARSAEHEPKPETEPAAAVAAADAEPGQAGESTDDVAMADDDDEVPGVPKFAYAVDAKKARRRERQRQRSRV